MERTAGNSNRQQTYSERSVEGQAEDHGHAGRGMRDKMATLGNGNDNVATAARRKTHGYELVLDPVVVLDHLEDRLALEGGVGDVGELCV